MANKKEVKETKVEKVVEKSEKATKNQSKRKTRRDISMELRKLKDDIMVEITNISPFNCCYKDRSGDVYFDIQMGEYAELTLAELKSVVDKSKGFFTEYSLILTDVFNDEYTLEDIMMYLNLDNIYKGISDVNQDFLEEVLIGSDEELERIVKLRDRKFVNALACKAVYLTKNNTDDFELSRRKEKILCDALNREYLIK